MAEISLPDARINPDLLVHELHEALGGEWGVISRKGQWFVLPPDGREKDEEAVLALARSHNPEDLSPDQAKQQRIEEKATTAKTDVAKIPAWATMTEAEAVAQIQNSVTDLASAKQALVAMSRMIVHLRDALWPELGEEQDAQRG